MPHQGAIVEVGHDESPENGHSRFTPRSVTLSSVVMIVLPTVSVVLESLGSLRIIA